MGTSSTMWGPRKIAKLVYNYNFTFGFMVIIYNYN